MISIFLSRTVCCLVLATVVSITAVPAGANPFGIVAHIPSATVSDEIVNAGIQWVRIDFIWALVELEQDELDWRIYDELVANLEARNLKIFATIQGTPQWATDGVEFSGVPRDVGDWKDFCYRAAQRYQGRVHAWGLWNEANLSRFWNGSRTEYIELILIEGARSLRAADPMALICGPELAHLTSANWDRWLSDVIDDAGDFLDVITHHAYPSGTFASDVTQKLEGEPEWPWDPPSVRTVLDREGWAARPVWLTETGMESDTYDEGVQRRFYVDLLDDWFPGSQGRRWIDRVFFYQMVDDPNYPDVSFGILRAPPALTPKLAFTAYQNATSTAFFDDAELRGIDIPEFVDPAEGATLIVEFGNVGQTTWYPGDHRLVVSTSLSDWTLSGGAWVGGQPVSPGGAARFLLQLAAPSPWRTRPPFNLRVFARMERRDEWYFGPALARTVRVSSDAPARILVQPRSQTTTTDGTARLMITAESPESLARYRWRHNSVDLTDGVSVTGSATPTLVLSAVDLHLTGDYDCVVTNRAGRVTSKPAEIRIAAADGPVGPPRRGRDRRSPTEIIRDTLQRFNARMSATH